MLFSNEATKLFISQFKADKFKSSAKSGQPTILSQSKVVYIKGTLYVETPISANGSILKKY